MTAHAWGTIWTRPGLERKQRSMINIALLAAGGKSTELAGHIKGGLTNGLTETEIIETLLQTAGYSGFPVGMESFRVADKAIEEWKKQHAK